MVVNLQDYLCSCFKLDNLNQIFFQKITIRATITTKTAIRIHFQLLFAEDVSAEAPNVSPGVVPFWFAVSVVGATVQSSAVVIVLSAIF